MLGAIIQVVPRRWFYSISIVHLVDAEDEGAV